jgi:hypothetical protein
VIGPGQFLIRRFTAQTGIFWPPMDDEIIRIDFKSYFEQLLAK